MSRLSRPTLVSVVPERARRFLFQIKTPRGSKSNEAFSNQSIYQHFISR